MLGSVCLRSKFAAWLDQDKLDAIAETVPPLAIPPWRWLGSKFYARGGAFMCAAVNDDSDGKKLYSVSIDAKTEHPLQFLKPYLDNKWEYVAV